jgi:hypothetical protein
MATTFYGSRRVSTLVSMTIDDDDVWHRAAFYDSSPCYPTNPTGGMVERIKSNSFKSMKRLGHSFGVWQWLLWEDDSAGATKLLLDDDWLPPVIPVAARQG